MVDFKFVPLPDARVTPEIASKFLNVGQLIEWKLTDDSGTYTGLVIVGEKQIPGGFQSFADMTFDKPAKEVPMAKAQAVMQTVVAEFQQRGVVGLSPGKK